MKNTIKEVDESVNLPKVSLLGQFFTLMIGLLVVIGAVYFALGWAVNVVVDHLSHETYAKLQQRVSQHEFLPVAKKMQQLQDLLDELVALSPNPDLKLKFRVLCEPQFNAVALPDGSVVFFEKLLRSIHSENELAMVMGHEIGHYISRDHMKVMGRGILLVLFSMLFQMEDVDWVGPSTSMYHAKYSQHQETLADEMGANLVHKKYGHISGIESFFRTMETIDMDEHGHKHPGKFVSWFSTHPHPQDRWKHLKQQWKKTEGEGKETFLDLSEIDLLCPPKASSQAH
ncbi:MAG: M48 family metallopeptidase [Bdellovibrionota bacterium]